MRGIAVEKLDIVKKWSINTYKVSGHRRMPVPGAVPGLALVSAVPRVALMPTMPAVPMVALMPTMPAVPRAALMPAARRCGRCPLPRARV